MKRLATTSRESQLCILTPDGEVTEVRIATTRERFREVLGDRPRARVLIETSTESEWVARCVKELGREAAPRPDHAGRRLPDEVRRGKVVATVALARKLAGILFAMLRDGTPFDPGKQVGVPAAVAA